ncbi:MULTISPECIES: HAD domain-containing protein [Butyrivibrio]|uniref:HAD domain-containing protein n=1 Tax=Butyrivibrio TaxID=830 RepID=UPI0003F9D285|nr:MULTISPECIES: HAD domain-containing protein [Butyrivibrio]
MQNIIFLDIDGVLNSKFWDEEHQREISDGRLVDAGAVRLLAELIKKADAKLILHSGWRFWFDENLKPLRPEAEHLITVMAQEGIRLDGVTPDLTTEEIRKSKKFSLVKAEEILLWLKENIASANSDFSSNDETFKIDETSKDADFPANWLVLDDLELHNGLIARHQVKPDPNVGLTHEDVRRALNILKL